MGSTYPSVSISSFSVVLRNYPIIDMSYLLFIAVLELSYDLYILQ
uniref:Uncharacterized protein n=1 Tax=Utricularia reniformis TaxID=192314 RepID=A0A1Y0B3J5_9LAMI|nr:hypothetical protein AEK19_MT1796 [Utricularia reniformis]ART31968.1 hypothetical protein AEK19_MT1796 [Utricularia reniformis]